MNNLALGYLTLLLTSNVEESDLKYGRAMEKDGCLATIAKGGSFENASISKSDQYTCANFQTSAILHPLPGLLSTVDTEPFTL